MEKRELDAQENKNNDNNINDKKMKENQSSWIQQP